MSERALEIRVGPTAARRLAEEGWHPELISGLLGASGGPKWLILGYLDRAISERLLSSRASPLHAVGSSIGSWRHAMLAQPDAVAAIDRFEAVYLEQHYSEKPTVEEITAVSRELLLVALGDGGATNIAHHPWFHSHIVTARGKGLNNRTTGAALAVGLGLAAVGNAVSRQTLPVSFQRVVFAHQAAQPLKDFLAGFNTHYAHLTADNVPDALMASGAIPYVFSGVCDVPGGPSGAYWDGGIIDYHFDVAGLPSEGLWLYPHFSKRATVGWFDKLLPWRAGRSAMADNLIMLCPSDAFIRQLPHGKIPDRRDFTAMTPSARQKYWRHCVAQSQRLADEFHRLVTGSDPLNGVIKMQSR